MSMAVAGATVGVGDFLGVDKGSAAQASQATGLDALTSDPAALLAEVGKNLQAHAVQVGVSTGMQVITGEMKWKEALQQGVINVAANTAGELAANEIGKLYDAGKGPIGYVEHKVRHIVLGSVEGLIMGHRDPLKGFISGGIAAGGAEIIAEGLPSTMSMQARKNVVLMTAGAGAFLLGGDVNVAAMAASNAFENNFAMSETLPALTPAIPVMEWLGLAGLGAAATVAASAMGLATGGFAGGNYLANQSEQNSALGEIWVDSDSYYGPVKSKLTPHESRPSILGTPGFEYDPIIFSTPLTERRSSVLATPVADFPLWKEGFTQWKGPIFQNFTPVADNMPNTTVLANSRYGAESTYATKVPGFMGKKGFELKNPSYQKIRNAQTTINDRIYSGHALDQMQNRRLTPSVIEHVIRTGDKFETREGTAGHYDSMNNVRVITNSSTGKVVTVIHGKSSEQKTKK